MATLVSEKISPLDLETKGYDLFKRYENAVSVCTLKRSSILKSHAAGFQGFSVRYSTSSQELSFNCHHDKGS